MTDTRPAATNAAALSGCMASSLRRAAPHPAVLAAFITNGVFTALLVLLIVLGVQQLEGHILQPFILGRAVRVHPLGVILSVAAGGFVAGIGGAVVAVPLVAVANTVVTSLFARH